MPGHTFTTLSYYHWFVQMPLSINNYTIVGVGTVMVLQPDQLDRNYTKYRFTENECDIWNRMEKKGNPSWKRGFNPVKQPGQMS